jgi:hypothetical protein
MESRQARELDEAARELSKAAKEIGEAARLWKDREKAARADMEGGLPEDEAVRLANEAVHDVRREFGAGGFSREAVTPAEAEDWVRRREERRRRDGYRPM